jgi:hypothetical protein
MEKFMASGRQHREYRFKIEAFSPTDSPAYLEKLSGMRNILITRFDEVAAIVLAALEVEGRTKRGKREALPALGQSSDSTVRL